LAAESALQLIAKPDRHTFSSFLPDGVGHKRGMVTSYAAEPRACQYLQLLFVPLLELCLQGTNLGQQGNQRVRGFLDCGEVRFKRINIIESARYAKARIENVYVVAFGNRISKHRDVHRR